MARLSQELVAAGLATRWLGRPVFYFTETDSTNHRAKEAAGQGVPAGALFLADHQSAGKGRLNRPWLASPGRNLLFSLLLRRPADPRAAFRLTMAAAVSLAEAVRTATGLPALIKWPNDVYLFERKLAGILTELIEPGRAVVGVGLNVGASPPDLPAIHLNEAAGREVDRLVLLNSTLTRLEDLLDEGPSAEPLRRLWEELSLTLGRVVTVVDGEETLTGQAVALDEDGALLLRTTSGQIQRVVCGDLISRGDDEVI